MNNTPKTHRREQMDELIRQELSAIVTREIEFPLGSLATITNVIVDGELKRARILFTAIPVSKTTDVFIVLKRHRRVLQRLLNRRLAMSYIPDILFEIDNGDDEKREHEDASVDSLLAQVSREMKQFDKMQEEKELANENN